MTVRYIEILHGSLGCIDDTLRLTAMRFAPRGGEIEQFLRIGLRCVPARLDSLNIDTFNGLGEDRHRKACKTDTCKTESERAVHYPSPG